MKHIALLFTVLLLATADISAQTWVWPMAGRKLGDNIISPPKSRQRQGEECRHRLSHQSELFGELQDRRRQDVGWEHPPGRPGGRHPPPLHLGVCDHPDCRRPQGDYHGVARSLLFQGGAAGCSGRHPGTSRMGLQGHQQAFAYHQRFAAFFKYKCIFCFVEHIVSF